MKRLVTLKQATETMQIFYFYFTAYMETQIHTYASFSILKIFFHVIKSFFRVILKLSTDISVT
jgi:hypothetical protein